MTHTPARQTTPTTRRTRARRTRTRRAAVTMALLLIAILSALALPATAATGRGATTNVGVTNVGITHIGVTTTGGATATRSKATRPPPTPATGSGVGTPEHTRASAPTGTTGALIFGALCLTLILATAGGVLWYTVRTRRTLDPDPNTR